MFMRLVREDGAQHLHNPSGIPARQGGDGHRGLQAALEGNAHFIAAAGVHQVSRLRDQHVPAPLAPQDVGHLQRAAAVAGIQHEELPVPQIGQTLGGDGAVRVRGGHHHNHVHILQRLRQLVGDQFRRSLALDLAGNPDGFQLPQAADFLAVNVLELHGIALAGQNRRHGLAAGAGADDCKLQHVASPHRNILLHKLNKEVLPVFDFYYITLTANPFI